MAEERARGGERRLVEPDVRQHDRDGALRHIEQHCGRGEPLAAGAQHVGRADIARSDRPQIARAGEAGEDHPERNRAEQIAEKQGQERREKRPGNDVDAHSPFL